MKSTEYWLVHEHTQFELLLRECKAAASISDWPALEHSFSRLVEALRFHIAQEEEILFPAYDAKCEPSHMSTRELYNEHSVIVDGFRILHKIILTRSPQASYDCIASIEKLLIDHNQKEESA